MAGSMLRLKYRQVAQLVGDLATNPQGTWEERRKAFRAACEAEQCTEQAEEFLSWFGGTLDSSAEEGEPEDEEENDGESTD